MEIPKIGRVVVYCYSDEDWRDATSQIGDCAIIASGRSKYPVALGVSNGMRDGWSATVGWYENSSENWRKAKVIHYKENKKTIMQKVTTMFKLLVDSDTQTLKKAGYINGDLELTIDGNIELMSVVFSANKAALVASAQAKLDEEAKNK